jgi:hypothetical protein
VSVGRDESVLGKKVRIPSQFYFHHQCFSLDFFLPYIIIQLMDYIPLNCPLSHVYKNISTPLIGEVESGIAVSVRLKCPHKHHQPHRGWVEFTTDRYGNVTWCEVPIEERIFYKDLPVLIGK